jgi:hypothetical protein
MKPKQVVYATCLHPVSPEVIAQIFAQQLSSGLWEGDDGTERGALVATTRALSDCADSRIDSAHPVYGTRVEKAIHAVCDLARASEAGPGMPDEADVILAIVAAVKTAADERLRAEAAEALRALRSSGLSRQRRRRELS